MKINYLLIRLALTFPIFLSLNACKKDNIAIEDKHLSEKTVADITNFKNKFAITKISGVVNPIDIQFDYDGKLYILTTKCIKTINAGKLKTLALPDTVFTDFSTYDGWILGPAKHIAIDRKGTIYLARTDGLRIVYPNSWVTTYVQGDIGWGISGLQDLALTHNDDLYYCNGDIVRAVPDFIQTPTNFFSSGIYPISEGSNISVYAMDFGNDNVAWIGTNNGIGSVLLPPNPDFQYNPGYEFKVNFLGDQEGKKSEGPIAKVKLGKISQLESNDDGSIIYFIEAGNLKQLKMGIVKTITPMANETRIALSKDATKLYFITNGDLNVLALD